MTVQPMNTNTFLITITAIADDDEITHFTVTDGGPWIERAPQKWIPWIEGSAQTCIFSIKTKHGREWDCLNGWRDNWLKYA